MQEQQGRAAAAFDAVDDLAVADVDVVGGEIGKHRFLSLFRLTQFIR
jgi:hypothetical protein